jgi:hypothetical protein
VQRLTNTQWENSVRDILRLPPETALATDFTLPPPGAEFSNNERVLFVQSREALDFESGAEAAAALATGSAEALAALDAGNDARSLVRSLGRRAFRRPLTSDEEAKYEAVFALGESLYGAGFANGAALVIRALLQSPHFLYRTELGPANEPLSGYEIASKLSFWLLGTTPSDTLLDAAAGGAYDSVAGLEAAAREMLETPAAAAVMRDFHGQLYDLARYATVSKPGVPEYDAETNAELAEASARFFDRVFSAGEGVRDIFTSTRAFVGPGLAPLYGFDAPSDLEERELGSSRRGYFMQVPFLLLNANNRVPHPFLRGLAIHFDVLCAVLPPPPATEIPVPPALEPGQTNRERFTALTEGCGGACHNVFADPLGYAFEAFDGMGEFRDEDNGRPIDTTGSYPFAEGTRDFSGAAELMGILAESPQAHTCYAKKLTGYALQRDVVEPDRPLLEDLAESSRADSLKALALALVRDPAFRVRQAP